MAKIAVYVSGSVAAFKAVSVVRQLQKAGHQVRVGLTAAGAKFVSPTTLYSGLSGLVARGPRAGAPH